MHSTKTRNVWLLFKIVRSGKPLFGASEHIIHQGPIEILATGTNGIEEGFVIFHVILGIH